MTLYYGWKCLDCDIVIVSTKRIGKKKMVMFDLCKKCYDGGKILYATEDQKEAEAFNRVIELVR